MKPPRHILFVPSWYADDAPEGAFIHEQARMTAMMGYRVGFVYVEKGPPLSWESPRWWSKNRVQYGVLKRWHLPKAWWMKTMWKLQYRQLFKAYVDKHGTPDMLHAHGYVAGMAARYLSSKAGIPYILTEHSTTVPNGTIPMYHRSDLRRTYRDAAAVIAVSAFLKAAIQEFMHTDIPVYVIGNPVDLARFPMRSGSRSANLFRILSIGSLEPRKNYELLLRAIALIASSCKIEVEIIGTGPEQSKLHALARDLQIAPIVNIIDHVSDDEIVDYLGRSDLFVSSSLKENFGVAIVEAMACGIPVIVTPSGGPEEYMSPVAGKLLMDHRPETLSRAVMDVYKNYNAYKPDLIREIAAQFRFETIGPQVEALYSRILD